MGEPLSRSLLRKAAALGAILSTLPYLTIKLIWLSGNPLGLNDVRLMHDPVMVFLNGVTFFMEACALALALVFGLDCHYRAPAWLLLPPVWAATGLLLPLLSVIVLQLAQSGNLAVASKSASAPLQPWVFQMVYGAFAALGVFLSTSFCLYAAQRWGRPLAWRGALPLASGGRASLTNISIALLEASAAAILIVRPTQGPLDFVLAGLAVLGIAALVLLTQPLARRAPLWVSGAVLWTASAALCCWGIYFLFLTLAATPLSDGASAHPWIKSGLFVQVVAGATAALTGIFIYQEAVRLDRYYQAPGSGSGAQLPPAGVGSTNPVDFLQYSSR